MTTKIAFTLPAEAVAGASEAILLGDFNNWNPEKAPKLERQADGSYKAFAQLEEGNTYHYRFLLDNERWVNDYNAQNYVYDPGFYVDNCEITVPVSEHKENKKAAPAQAETLAKKEIKSKTPTKAAPAKEAATQKVAVKTKTPVKEALPAQKAKSVEKKADEKKVENPGKAVKKSAPKAKK